MNLTFLEGRILACLVEKELTTPEIYPLTLKALQAACNQKNNRHPVIECSEADLMHALDSLRFGQWLWRVNPAGSRVDKYEHNLLKQLALNQQELALLCELILRGPQTPAELKSHASRLFPFSHMIQVESALTTLAQEREDREPLVLTLPRALGQKETRVAHLLCGAPDPQQLSATRPAAEGIPVQQTLLETIEELRMEIADLRREFDDFKSKF